MMARSFHPHLASWVKPRRPSTPQEPSPEGEADDVLKKPLATTAAAAASDSDNETASAASSEPMSTPSLAGSGGGVASSFARAGKLLWNKNPLSGLAAFTKPHSRTVSDFSEVDFTTPFAAGTPVWTRYGLGTVASTREDDGFLIVNLQCLAKMTLYLNPADEDYFSVPALRHDWVETPAGEGLVVAFDPKQHSYRVRIGGSSGARTGAEVNVHRSDLRRLLPVRRQAPTPAQAQQQQPQPHAATTATTTPSLEPSVLTKGFNSAFKTIVTTSSGLTNSLSNYYYQGQCVVTTFGQGTIVALDQTSHRAQVQLTWGATAFVSTDAILHYTKALVGMDVTTTKFGSGVVTDMRPADGMYTVKLHAFKEGEQEVVYVHESDLVRGRRTRLSSGLASAPQQITGKINASTTKLFSFASNTVKLFGQGTATKLSPTPAPVNALKTPTPTAPTRSKSMHVVEEDDVKVSTAGI